MSTGSSDVFIRRRFVEVLMSVGAVTLLLIALVALDVRVREQVSRRFMVRPSVEMTTTVTYVRNTAHVIAAAARTQSFAHAPLLIFTLAASVLVVFMLRT
jgi:hypothetical protein